MAKDEQTLKGDQGAKNRRSRRELLAGAAGALGVVAAESLIGVGAAQAADGNNVVLGQINTESHVTTISQSSNADGLYVSTSGNIAAAIHGHGDAYVGVLGGCSSSGTGVFGVSSSGNGVQGESDTGTGVLAIASGGLAGMLASSASGEGAYGASGSARGTNAGQTRTGVHGVTDEPSASAVWGEHATSGPGVSGTSSGIGVQGVSSGSSEGVSGQSASGDGVLGSTAGSGNAVHGNHTGGGYGVYGQTNSEGSAGVWGDNASGAGVKGTSGFIGLYGHVTGLGGYGVWGVTTVDGATGVYADASGTNGTALDVNGPAVFALSGLVSIVAGAKSATVAGVSLRSGSLVLATVQNNAGVSVSYALPNVSQSKVTITLNKVVPLGKTANVAWFVVN